VGIPIAQDTLLPGHFLSQTQLCCYRERDALLPEQRLIWVCYGGWLTEGTAPDHPVVSRAAVL